MTAMGAADPPTDRPDTPPWLEATDHLAVVLDDLEEQVARATQAGVPTRHVLRVLGPLETRLARLVLGLQAEATIRSIGTAVAW